MLVALGISFKSRRFADRSDANCVTPVRFAPGWFKLARQRTNWETCARAGLKSPLPKPPTRT
jgi:hypothetical protein